MDAVRADPRRAYSEAAHDVLDAFAADGTADAPFALPEFGEGAVFPGAMAMGFHFVDYVVHGWDVAASLGVPFELPDRRHRGRAAVGARSARRRLSQHGGSAVRTRRRTGRHGRLRTGYCDISAAGRIGRVPTRPSANANPRRCEIGGAPAAGVHRAPGRSHPTRSRRPCAARTAFAYRRRARSRSSRAPRSSRQHEPFITSL